MAVSLLRAVSRALGRRLDRSLQPERPLRIRAGRPLSPHAGIDSALRAPRRPPGLLEHARFAPSARPSRRTPPAPRRCGGDAASIGSRVLLQRLSCGADAMSAMLVVPQWTACAAAFGAFLLLLVGLDVYARGSETPAEVTRKLLHSGSGALTLTFPFLFRDLWPVLLLTGSSAGVLAAVKFVAPLRARLGAAANRVARPTLGEFYFPLSVAVIFCFTRDEHPLLFVIPILILTLADSICAIVGGRYGATRLPGTAKSLEGSVAFAIVAFLCVLVPLLLWTDIGRAQTLLIAVAVALFTAALEAIASRGLDNLIVVVGGFVLLREMVRLV